MPSRLTNRDEAPLSRWARRGMFGDTGASTMTCTWVGSTASSRSEQPSSSASRGNKAARWRAAPASIAAAPAQVLHVRNSRMSCATKTSCSRSARSVNHIRAAQGPNNAAGPQRLDRPGGASAPGLRRAGASAPGIASTLQRPGIASSDSAPARWVRDERPRDWVPWNRKPWASRRTRSCRHTCRATARPTARSPRPSRPDN